jgi:hypothetical protein
MWDRNDDYRDGIRVKIVNALIWRFIEMVRLYSEISRFFTVTPCRVN